MRLFDAVLGVGHPVPCQNFGRDDVEADAAELGVRAGEVLVHSSWPRPSASKVWAPVYEATVEMPILDMIFRTPLPRPLIRL